jgi:pantoate--beta-alanine ligase
LNIYKKVLDLQNEIFVIRQKKASIGFVPTMGALHIGHLSLIEKAKLENDFVICSIFVNPIQFNNKEDYEKYPRLEEFDINMLNEKKCDLLFLPSEKEIYPKPSTIIFNFGNLDKVMEGKFREGHFQGVAKVVSRFFEIINPDRAYFGEKDFQQLTIIRELTKQFFPTINVISCPIVREPDGLALSSRNMRLTMEERKMAPFIYKTLKKAKEKVPQTSVLELKKWVENEINSQALMKLEYFEISSIQTLQPIDEFENKKKYIACIAVFIGKVRLIDNIILEN